MDSNEQVGQPSEFNLKRLDRAMNNHSKQRLFHITANLKDRLVKSLSKGREYCSAAIESCEFMEILGGKTSEEKLTIIKDLDVINVLIEELEKLK